jgi:hypothetical protein
LALSSGCASRGDMELLEASLRQQQDISTGYQRQLADLKNDLDAARAEVEQLRTQLAAVGSKAGQEFSEPLARVSGVTFNSMMTGGRDQDGTPGADVITAVFSPHDQDGDLVKLAGTIEVELLDLSRSGEEQRIGQWKFSSAEAHKLWHSGFLASGYQLELPIAERPTNGQAVLHGRLITPDGRQFDTTHTVTISDTEKSASPKGLKPDANARPITGVNRKVKPLGGGIKVPGAEIVPTESAAAVMPAGYVSIDDSEVPDPVSILEEPAAKPMPPAKPNPAGKAEGARPFPAEAVQTSDNWTDETIPRIR